MCSRRRALSKPASDARPGLTNDKSVELIREFGVDGATIDFSKFLEMVKAGQPEQPGEEPDPKVLEFLRILEQYRRKCESEGSPSARRVSRAF